MEFDRDDIEIPLGVAARIVVRRGGRPTHFYAVMLQVRISTDWHTIRLIDNAHDIHHMHRYHGFSKIQPGEQFFTGTVNQAIPQAIRYMTETYGSIIESWVRTL